MNDIPDDPHFDLLASPLFALKIAGEVKWRTLPSILAALWQEEVSSFEHLRTHQVQSWGSFLSQVMSMALAHGRKRDEDPATLTEEEWRALLLNLSGRSREAWQLLVEDVSKPAFMQSPVPEGSLEEAKYKDPYLTPDQLDMLVTAKNHDLKRELMTSPLPSQWVYALVSLQTMEGFLGRGNYGIARMNGGFSNRPRVGLVPGLSWSARLRRDVQMLLEQRDDQSVKGYDLKGHALLWLLPWDGNEKIPLPECDPQFVEICRRLRVGRIEGSEHLCVWRANTNASRLDAPSELQGDTKDAWTPMQTDGKKGARAMTVSGGGYSYDLVRKILFRDEMQTPYALYATPAEKQLKHAYLYAEALVRGQGITEGLHQRVIPIPLGKASFAFLKKTSDEEEKQRAKLASRAKKRVEQSALFRSKVLYPALCKLVDSSKVDRWTQAFGEDVDGCFFPQLWESLSQSDEEAEKQWQQQLFTLGNAQLEAAIEATPLAQAKRWRQISEASGIFHGSARKILTTLFPARQPDA